LFCLALQSSQLREVCLYFIVNNYAEVKRTAGYKKLSKELQTEIQVCSLCSAACLLAVLDLCAHRSLVMCRVVVLQRGVQRNASSAGSVEQGACVIQ
jgi:hypothetical protein